MPHPAALEMSVSVNGLHWGGNPRDMRHNFEQISPGETLYPSEVIGSGTVGTGCRLELERQLADGDLMELTIQNIGMLSNRIVMVLSRLRSGLSTHLCGLSFKSQGAFAAE